MTIKLILQVVRKLVNGVVNAHSGRISPRNRNYKLYLVAARIQTMLAEAGIHETD